MTIKEVLVNTQNTYKLSPLDAEILLSYALKKPREYLFAHPEHRLTFAQTKKFLNFCKRRSRGEPVAYIREKKEFFGLDFMVDKNVLIPRPETEILVETTLKALMNDELGLKNVMDLGTGSGNIIVSIAKNIPAKVRKKINFYAVDISPKALRVAASNAKKHGVAKSIKFVKSDLLKFFFKQKFAGNVLIAANLPYVSEKLYKKHAANLKYEPRTALVSSNSGLDHYCRLFSQIKKLIVLGYVLHVTCYIEISPEQKNIFRKIVRKIFPASEITFSPDLAGKTRVACIKIA